MTFDLKQEMERKHTNEELYQKQVEVLQSFLERGAISQEQYDRSYADLAVKMGLRSQLPECLQAGDIT